MRQKPTVVDKKLVERIKQEDEIIKRYEKLKADDVADRVSLIMDLEYSGVDLDVLLASSDKDLLHDVSGIRCYMDRKSKKLGKGFVPRAGMREVQGDQDEGASGIVDRT